MRLTPISGRVPELIITASVLRFAMPSLWFTRSSTAKAAIKSRRFDRPGPARWSGTYAVFVQLLN
jgi:hypothetical protein